MLRSLAVAGAFIAAAMLFLYPSREVARARLRGLVDRVPRRGQAARSSDRASAAQDDAALAQRVRQEVRRDPRVPHDAIDVSAQAGVVTLRGEVDAWEDLGDVESRVRSIPGVARVENLLRLAQAPGSAG